MVQQHQHSTHTSSSDQQQCSCRREICSTARNASSISHHGCQHTACCGRHHMPHNTPSIALLRLQRLQAAPCTELGMPRLAGVAQLQLPPLQLPPLQHAPHDMPDAHCSAADELARRRMHMHTHHSALNTLRPIAKRARLASERACCWTRTRACAWPARKRNKASAHADSRGGARSNARRCSAQQTLRRTMQTAMAHTHGAITGLQRACRLTRGR